MKNFFLLLTNVNDEVLNRILLPSYPRLRSSLYEQNVCFTRGRSLASPHNPPLISGLGTGNMGAKLLNVATQCTV